ncbi:Major facilitator superfamily domain, general substrate transporter [Cordyceps fumosorosea ARSEF 2679]|uniref:Major facilitator superfamily domain, general substrate transporter n=1 Tax=Cordyceps fumosorosea (strain ARSEF 2679) TaxID=1081104 RepID=A0A167YA31_CORFA|nr:Major facilitator superfamily domain, general substrate transporter [Cordyceps fumosorosea ARSEF 2679]OAA66049.1 Major facilitator superfamily domain, general substrate transporter [Cordyceps fumosorosea ARSEF 2679]
MRRSCVNIGNARLYGLEADLGLTPSQFQVAVSVFFVPYLLLEVPSNLLLQRLTPRRWLAALSFTWGLVAALSGLVRSHAALLACRLLLGALEAGLFPGLTVYLTLFYTRRELARRVGYLFVSAAVAGALGGLLAFGIGKLDGKAGMRGWRWILIVEGLPSVVLGAATWVWLPSDTKTARFLSEGERARMELRRRGEYGDTKSGRELSARDVRAAFQDWKVWAFCAAQFGVDTMLYGYSTFLPTIIKGLGRWSPAQVQLLTIPCYFVGAAAYMAAATGSDRAGRRGPWCVGFGALSVVGYAVLLGAGGTPAGVRYFACFLVAAGLYVVVGLPLAWLPNNCPRYGKRATATGLQLTIGNAAGIMSSFLYPTAEGPRFVRGHAVTLAMVAVGTVIYGLMWAWYRRENGRRGPGGAAVKEEHKDLSDDELQELGDESPHFKYTT